MSWSGGKDACMALHRLRLDSTSVAGLLTTLVGGPDRVALHEVAAGLVRRQAAAVGLPLFETVMRLGASNLEYEAALAGAVARGQAKGADTLASGDLFLEDIRAYRDALAARLKVATIYPLWSEPTTAFAKTVFASGLKAIVCSVDLSRLDLEFAGRDYDETFLADLPGCVDPCGENGEFHTFVYDGPGFVRPVDVRRGAPLGGT